MKFWLLCHYIPMNMLTRLGNPWKWPLFELVVCVEKALDQQETALDVFLDIEGVFNNTSYDHVCCSF